MNTARSRTLSLIGVALVLVISVPGWLAAQTTFGRIVVFGTSLSDPGNAFAFQHEANTPPYSALGESFLVPAMSYARGGHHFSNGATWVEQFARPLGLAGNTRPAFQSESSKATNYAIGATRARADGINVSLSDQVNAFLQDFGGKAPSDALYVIEMGGNDVRDAFLVFASPGGDGTPIVNAALAAIGENIQALYSSGARRFLVWNAPNIGLTPAVQMFGLPAALLASSVANGFNDGLDIVLASLAQQLPGIQIAKLDVFDLINALVADPDAFGLTVVDTACITPDVPPFECKKPDEYLFWDGIHPTTAVHAIVAQQAAMALAQ